MGLMVCTSDSLESRSCPLDPLGRGSARLRWAGVMPSRFCWVPALLQLWADAVWPVESKPVGPPLEMEGQLRRSPNHLWGHSSIALKNSARSQQNSSLVPSCEIQEVQQPAFIPPQLLLFSSHFRCSWWGGYWVPGSHPQSSPYVTWPHPWCSLLQMLLYFLQQRQAESFPSLYILVLFCLIISTSSDHLLLVFYYKQSVGAKPILQHLA